jgi:hypothetical protein
MNVSDLVRREVYARLSADDAKEAERQLLATPSADLDLSAYARTRDRVQLAMLKEADGSLDRFSEALKLAASDWRDVLVCAGLADEDWTRVLHAAGYPVP